MSAIISKLEEINKRYLDLDQELISETVIANPRLMAKLAKEQASLRQIVEAYQHLKEVQENIAQAKQLLKEHDDDIKEMAELELDEQSSIEAELLEKIQILLIPKDPNDDHDALIEIRGAAGGDEGNIFAGDLYRMYVKYAENKGWRTEIMQVSESEAGGFTMISFVVKGDEAYRHLKFESGAHRVQRVPKTETQGRIHTSTATVLVLADADEADMEIDDSELEIETHRASGAGGQHINKTDSAVRITHIPTGISVNCQDGRSQHENRATALRIIRARVLEELQRRQEEEKGAIRRSKIGKGDRSEKIRTYNYPQNRVTDHRIGLTLNQLDRIVEGKLDDVIEALIEQERKEILASQ
ncbi:MAG: peptide chain release factor 1 [Erysipelotrichaceae bacterium]|nr:peptide chain release factor 1 [Erysipelotrichaceae bacterium]MDD3924945.1 peptide chain release factor 1 [Erysipelotrichaceae bacterium]MDD4642622.1 peptide chain release factor 1 [Erysipelotrichaceae bacterium]